MLPVEHALPTPGHHPWRTIAVVVAGIATLELLGLVVVGTAFVTVPGTGGTAEPPAFPRLRDTFVSVPGTGDNRKQAEIDYPAAIGEAGRAWLRSKPFANTPRESARLLIDFGYVLQLLDLRPG